MARLEMSSTETIMSAAQGGAVDALFDLGLMYSTGRDAPVDLVTAHKWFNLAALRGNDEARRYRLEISRELNKKEIADAQKQAREWLRAH